jgi:hypothetical protein
MARETCGTLSSGGLAILRTWMAGSWSKTFAMLARMPR